MKKFLIISATVLLAIVCWPARLFTKRSSCYHFTLENLITKGGSFKFYKAKHWWGYHVSYIKDGYEYHYDQTKEQKRKGTGTPWAYVGHVTQVKINSKESKKFSKRFEN